MSGRSASVSADDVPISRRDYFDVVVVVAVLTVTNLVANFTTEWASVVAVPVAAAALLAYSRYRGVSWAELGLSTRHWRSGARYGLAAAGLVLAVVAVGVALPITREFFLNESYATISGALLASLVVIPLQTVLPEELLFRGVLNARLTRVCGVRGVYVFGAILFGLWHIAPSLGLSSGNQGLNDSLGGGTAAAAVGVVLAVLATTAAGVVFIWLRRRSGSLLAPIGLHWALNGVGALAAALAWQIAQS